MWMRLWKYAIFTRVITLALGCSSTMPANHTTTLSAGRSNASETRSEKSGTRTSGHKAASAKSTEGTAPGTAVRLKGKGSNTETASKRVTAKKMEEWDVTAEKVLAVSALVEAAAEQYNVPSNLVYGVIWVESRFNPEAVSPVGARGLMQLMPKTADYLAECIKWEGTVDSFDPAFNIAAGTYYISRLIKQFDDDVDLALAAYNAGPTNIRRWMGNTGLPEVSIEYYTMVQTAQQYFPSASAVEHDAASVPTTDDLDRLGLAILIAGLSKQEFGLERPDDANPFNNM